MQATSPTYHNTVTDIVCFSLSRWDAAISSPAVSLARELARKHRVFFIEHPYSLKDFVAGKRNKEGRRDHDRVVVIRPPLVLPVNFLPEGKWYDRFAGINQAIMLKTLRRVIKRHHITRYVFINFFDPWFLRIIPADIKPMTYVYQCMDDLSQVDYTRRHGVRLENEVISRADIVLCTSRELTRLKSEISPNVYFHPNAADFALFNTAAGKRYDRPADMPHDNRKVVGFTGSIEYRTDFALLKKVAQAHADKWIFLVGPVSGNEPVQSGVSGLPNVIFAGARDLEALPAYLQYFDCCIIPYKINKLTASIYPLKINEYLAAGKPVVTTRFSEDIFSFRHVAYVAGSDEEFIRLIDTSIAADNDALKAARIAVARENSWEERVRSFWNFFT